MAVNNRIRKCRTSNAQTNSHEGKVFFRLLICAGIVCSFMLVKDMTLPSGMVVSQFVVEYLDANLHIDKIAKKFKDVAVPVFGGTIKDEKNTDDKPSENKTPAPEEKATEEKATEEGGTLKFDTSFDNNDLQGQSN